MDIIFLAGLYHETHSFLDETTTLDDFQRCGWGSEIDIAVPGSPIAAMFQRFKDVGSQIEIGPHYYAKPSGVVADDVLTAWRRDFLDAWELTKESPDAIFLVLHGAMVAESDPDVEASMVEWIRRLPGAGTIPIYAVLDLHANVSERLANGMNGFLAYRENPHTDSAESAVRVVDMYLQAREKQITHRTFWRGTSLVWSPSGTGTALSPLRELEQLARQAETRQGIAGVNVFAGYSYADMPDTGVSFSIVAEDGCKRAVMDEVFHELVSEANRLKELGNPGADSVATLRETLAGNLGKTVIAAEPSDNIGAGAPGDCTGLLRLFLKEGFSSAGVIINDPQAVASLQSAVVGSMVSLKIGGRGSRFDAGPLAVEAKFVCRFEGAFQLEDPRSHAASMGGNRVNMGPCAVIEVAGVTILLTSRKTAPFDLGQWRVAGIQPEEFALIGVKAAVAYRQAYNPIACAHLQMDTPGPCPLDLRSIPFRNIRRPVYPLDV